MKKHSGTILLVLIFFVGLAVMLYPTISDYINQRNQTRVVNSYAQQVDGLSDADYTAYFDAADVFNQEIAADPDALYHADHFSTYSTTLDVTGTGIMGYITIPRIGVELPIYHGTSDAVLQVAAGHLEGTSLPVGGESTHAVISAHRGLPSAKLFTHLDRLEADISDGETEVLTGAHEAYLDRIIAWRQELLRLKRYYEQLDSIFDELAENDNSLLGKQNTRRFANLGNRMERYLNAVQSLRESVAQLREAYQSQLSIQQNDLMKIFTVVTAVFLPLTLLVGWYGMNFVGMPELHWKYGYPAVILVSVGIVAALVIYFKKKKWL